MDKSLFNQLSSNLQRRILECDQHFGLLENLNTLEELSLKQIKELLSFSQAEYEIQSHILTVDLYHILTMGNLDAIQAACFTRLIKDYGKYRPIINKLGRSELDLNNLPALDTESTYYHSTYLGGYVLGTTAVNEEKMSIDMDVAKPTTRFNSRFNAADALPYTYFNKKTGELRYDLSQTWSLARYLITHTDLFSGFKQASLADHLGYTGTYGNYRFLVADGVGQGDLVQSNSNMSIECLLSKMQLPEKLN